MCPCRSKCMHKKSLCVPHTFRDTMSIFLCLVRRVCQCGNCVCVRTMFFHGVRAMQRITGKTKTHFGYHRARRKDTNTYTCIGVIVCCGWHEKHTCVALYMRAFFLLVCYIFYSRICVCVCVHALTDHEPLHLPLPPWWCWWWCGW